MKKHLYSKEKEKDRSHLFSSSLFYYIFLFLFCLFLFPFSVSPFFLSLLNSYLSRLPAWLGHLIYSIHLSICPSIRLSYFDLPDSLDLPSTPKLYLFVSESFQPFPPTPVPSAPPIRLPSTGWGGESPTGCARDQSSASHLAGLGRKGQEGKKGKGAEGDSSRRKSIPSFTPSRFSRPFFPSHSSLFSPDRRAGNL